MSTQKRDLAWEGMNLEEAAAAGVKFSGELVPALEVETNWRILMWTTSACASANWVWRESICCCNDEMAPTHPYTGSRTLAFASYTIELTASLRWCSGNSCKLFSQLFVSHHCRFFFFPLLDLEWIFHLGQFLFVEGGDIAWFSKN